MHTDYIGESTEEEQQPKKHILIADDDPSILEVVEMVLEDEGYEVEKILDGTLLFESRNTYPDLLLLDIGLSGVDGRNICTFFKSTADLAHIPIVMISANKDTERIASEAGANEYLKKPFEIEELLAIVHKYC